MIEYFKALGGLICIFAVAAVLAAIIVATVYAFGGWGLPITFAWLLPLWALAIVKT